MVIDYEARKIARELEFVKNSVSEHVINLETTTTDGAFLKLALLVAIKEVTQQHGNQPASLP